MDEFGLRRPCPARRCRINSATTDNEVSEVGATQRILPHAIEDKYVIGAGGDLELVTAGSTRPITQTIAHAGIVTTTVYELRVPAGALDHQGMRIVP